MLPRAITVQLLKPIPRWHAQFVQAHRGIDVAELAEHHAPKFRRERPNQLALPQALGIAVGEAANHLV